MDTFTTIIEKSSRKQESFKPITVEKPLDVEYDVGNLLVFDKNELDADRIRHSPDDYLLSLTRDNVQLLLNQVWELPTERVEEAIVAKLPKPIYILPRQKRVPKPRPLTKWEKFAKEKGIVKKKKSKLTWDEQLQQWIPMFGFKRAKAQREKDWVLEVPKNANPMDDQFAKKTDAKMERVAKNELQRMRNIAKAKNVKIPRVGVTNPDVASSKDLQTAVTVAKASTASIGKFQNKLPKEKEARGVSEITPGASRKRKAPPIPGTQEKSINLEVIDSILNKKPKLDIEKAVARHINEENVQQSDETRQRPKAGRNGKKVKGRGASSKKPKGGKGQRKAGKSAGGGRKRR